MAIYDVPAQELIEKTSEKLKEVKEVNPPEWATFAKTGAHKERPPTQGDWWYIRSASVLRKIAILGPVGVSKLRVKYGGRKNRGFKKERFMLGSGNVLRKVLQQLEKAGFAKQDAKGMHKGRVVTPKGVSFLDKIAADIMKERKIVLPQKPKK